MFIPLHDANSLRHINRQYVTLTIIAVNVIAYLITTVGGTDFAFAAAIGLGYIPSVAYDLAVLPPELDLVPEPLTYITYTFLHGDLMHLGGNMLFLWVFGDNVEDALGHFRFLVFYLLCGVAGAYMHGFIAPASNAPLIGASGSIAGIVAAYLILHPRVKVWVLAFARIPLRIPAFVLLALWIGFQFLMLVIDTENQISWAAHAGGILAGAVLVFILKRRDVPLFDRSIEKPRAVELEKPDMARPLESSQPRWGRQ
ncbi:MAG: rhomboid family intramembrane serine protease [Nitratireductor sp.]|uniref:rhomboid family intramembrane serine protease n=1 Tax=Nitratireductor sp. TaxID=1872084 RepID=UPI00261D15B4|nr:rhomboid family intramembrane serine protease [Nitratireductor sp.]MCV0352209.1 rhomboid family intramembrane serine protease [Nitratireductor sp.]